MDKENGLERKAKHIPILRSKNVADKNSLRNSKYYLENVGLIVYHTSFFAAAVGLIFYGCSRII